MTITTNTSLKQTETIDTNNFRYMKMCYNTETGEPFVKFVTANAEWHFPLGEGWKIYICNQFIESLDLDVYTRFVGYEMYSEMIDYCSQELRKSGGSSSPPDKPGGQSFTDEELVTKIQKRRNGLLG